MISEEKFTNLLKQIIVEAKRIVESGQQHATIAMLLKQDATQLQVLIFENDLEKQYVFGELNALTKKVQPDYLVIVSEGWLRANLKAPKGTGRDVLFFQVFGPGMHYGMVYPFYKAEGQVFWDDNPTCHESGKSNLLEAWWEEKVA
jgi:hypothetical protein